MQPWRHERGIHVVGCWYGRCQGYQSASREAEVLAGIAEHLTNAEIADRLLADGPERARGEDELTAMGATPTALG